MNRRIAIAATATAGAVAVAALGWRLLRPDRDHYEAPRYTVDVRFPGLEVRHYAPTLEAQVTLAGTRQSATQEGFRILAGYIFGGNQAKQSIHMTAPVSATPTSQKIAMTAPVSATPSEQGWTVGFTMPREWTLDTLPTPDDARVRLVTVPAHLAAVRTFSGRARASRVEEEERALLASLAAQGLKPEGRVAVAQFDPPWVLGPWRRNEVQVALAH